MHNYEKEILRDSINQNTLIVMARGIGIIDIFTSVTQIYNIPQALCVVFGDCPEGCTDLTETSIEARRNLYKNGGVFRVTSRFFITDLFNDVIDINLISAVLFTDAHLLKRNCTEEFIIYKLRESNSECVVMGFTDDAISLNKYNDFSDCMAILRCNDVLLYPRFHTSVKESIDNENVLVNRTFNVSNDMRIIEVYLVELVNSICKDINRHSSINYESVLLSDTFCEEFVNFKILMDILYNEEFEDFYVFYKNMFDRQLNKGGWINSMTSHLLLEKITEIHSEEKKREKQNEPLYDENNILNYFKKKSELDGLKNDNVLDTGEKNDSICYDSDVINGLEGEKVETIKKESEENEDENKKISASNARGFEAKLIETVCNKKETEQLQKMKKNAGEIRNPKLKKLIEMSKDDIETIVLTKCENNAKTISNYTGIVCMTHVDFLKHSKTPTRVVLYNPDIGSIRRCEVIGVKNVEMMYFKNSLEEQKYLMDLRCEKEAFESLIMKRSIMPLNLNVVNKDFSNEKPKKSGTQIRKNNIFTSKNNDDLLYEDPYGNNWDEINFPIYIDIREMRSTLPFALYREGYEIFITTLEVGDYVVGNICIERKTIEDLLQSLTGRLYMQATAMQSKYRNNYLLIEFPCGDRMSLIERCQNDKSRSIIMSQILILLLNFNLKIIWSNSDAITIKSLDMLNRKHNNFGVVGVEEKTDPVLLEVLLNIPGINRKNLAAVIKNFYSLEELVSSDEGKLKNVLGDQRGKLAFSFFRQRFADQ